MNEILLFSKQKFAEPYASNAIFPSEVVWLERFQAWVVRCTFTDGFGYYCDGDIFLIDDGTRQGKRFM